MIRREAQKLSLLECRLEIYTTILEHTAQVAFNEIRLATDHTSRNDSKAIRTIVTFKQAALLVQSISLTQILNKEKLIVDISTIRPWNYSEKCYLMLDVFCLRSGTVHVKKRRFCTRYVQIKYFEASWPEALVAHRIRPLPGSMRAITKKRLHPDSELQQQDHDDDRQRSRNYVFMLQDLMFMIQDYLLLSDINKQRGALDSLRPVGSTAPQHEDNRICIWLEDV